MTDDNGLLTALEIQPEDLEANREGRLSRRQIRQLRGRIWARLLPLGGFVMVLVFVGLFVIQGLLNVREMDGGEDAGRFGWILLAILSLLAVLTIQQIAAEYRRERTRLSAAELKSIRGPVKLSTETGNEGETVHVVRIGSARFEVIPPVYEAFVPKRKYTLYYTSTTEQIVGAEPAD